MYWLSVWPDASCASRTRAWSPAGTGAQRFFIFSAMDWPPFRLVKQVYRSHRQIAMTNTNKDLAGNQA